MKTTFTKKEDSFIKQNYLKLPVKKMARELNRSGFGVRNRMRLLELVVPKELIEQRKKDSQRKPGQIPMNKGLKQADYMSPKQIEKTKATRFQKGNKPHNTIGVENGTIRVRKSSNGSRYKWIRISLNKWTLLHHIVWESIYGPKPKNSILRFRDGNAMNCSIDNLELIDQQSNMLLNSIQRYPDELQKSFKLLSKLKKQLKSISNGEE